MLTAEVITPWLNLVGMPWLNTLFVPLYYSSLVVSDLCSDIPPSLPQIDLSTLNATANTLLQVLRVVAMAPSDFFNYFISAFELVPKGDI